MTKHRTESAAQIAALFDGNSCGFCILDNTFYTGTVEQLERIACVSIRTPSPEAQS